LQDREPRKVRCEGEVGGDSHVCFDIDVGVEILGAVFTARCILVVIAMCVQGCVRYIWGMGVSLSRLDKDTPYEAALEEMKCNDVVLSGRSINTHQENKEYVLVTRLISPNTCIISAE
jgi:hypothetical protein